MKKGDEDKATVMTDREISSFVNIIYADIKGIAVVDFKAKLTKMADVLFKPLRLEGNDGSETTDWCGIPAYGVSVCHIVVCASGKEPHS